MRNYEKLFATLRRADEGIMDYVADFFARLPYEARDNILTNPLKYEWENEDVKLVSGNIDESQNILIEAKQKDEDEIEEQLALFGLTLKIDNETKEVVDMQVENLQDKLSEDEKNKLHFIMKMKKRMLPKEEVEDKPLQFFAGFNNLTIRDIGSLKDQDEYAVMSSHRYNTEFSKEIATILVASKKHSFNYNFYVDKILGQLYVHCFRKTVAYNPDFEQELREYNAEIEANPLAFDRQKMAELLQKIIQRGQNLRENNYTETEIYYSHTKIDYADLGIEHNTTNACQEIEMP